METDGINHLVTTTSKKNYITKYTDTSMRTRGL